MDIDKYNPFPSFQPGQAEAITQILNAYDDGEKVIELDAPTAAGKSLDLYVLGMVLTSELGVNKVIYSTPLVSLADQLGSIPEFSKMPVLKGKRNYDCNMLPIKADECPFKTFGDAIKHCRSHNINAKPCVDCTYQHDRQIFLASKFGATTFARYVVDPQCHQSCNVLLIDESAGLEKTLVDFATLKLPENTDKMQLKESIISYLQVLSEKIKSLEVYINKLQEKEKPISETTLGEIAEVNKRVNSTNREISKCNKVLWHIREDHKYMIDSEMKFRLLEGKSEFERLIDNLDLVVLASGTPTTGIYTDKYKTVTIQHPIPVERRLIYYCPVGSMSYKERQHTVPKMADTIERLHSKYQKKTIVHCGAYSVAKLIYDNLDNTRKVILQEDPKKRELYKTKFLKSKESIFLSIEFVEGLDLKGSEYYTNIIAKIPFEPTEDEFVKCRNTNDNWKRYNMHSAVEVMQAAGRCTRTINDYSETYILDSSWQGLYYKHKKLFKPWFQVAIRNIKSLNDVPNIGVV